MQTKERENAVKILADHGFRVQFVCEDWTLLYKQQGDSSSVKLIKVDNNGHIDQKPLAELLAELTLK